MSQYTPDESDPSKGQNTPNHNYYTPGQYTTPPPPVKRSRSMLNWYQSQSKKKQWGIGCGILVAAMFLCICSAAIAAPSSGQSANSPTPTATSAQVTAAVTKIATTAPTPTPQPTKAPTQVEATHGNPHVGGPLSDFVGEYGPPVIYTTFNDGSDIIIGTRQNANNIVNYVSVTAPDNWTTGQMRNYCLRFLPLDAIQYNEDDSDTPDILIDFHSSVGMVVADITTPTCMVYIGDQ